MGLFDYVKSEYKLPLPQEVVDDLSDTDWDEIEFQTKSFDYPTLDVYEISEEGSIYMEVYNRTGEGLLDRTRTGIEKIDYTGELIFYTDLMSKEWDYWIEFKALFFKGELKEIELNELEKKDPKERLEMEKLIQESFSKFVSREKSWWRKALTVVMFPVRLLLAIIKWLLGLTMKLVWKAERWIS
jgi:hypothetical protein